MTQFLFIRRFPHYWRVYKQIISFNLSLLLAYRLNVLVHSLYGFTFMLGVYLIILVAFTQTQTIGGFSQAEITLMYLTSLTLWTLLESTVFEGYKFFMIEDVATGQFDKYLLKPMIPQVLVAMSRPHLTSFVYFIVIFVGFIWYGMSFFLAANFLQIVGFVLFFLIGLGIHINLFSTYATLAFHLTRSSQLIRTLQSVSDQAFYPPPIYPKPIQIVMFSLLPTAYGAYIPVSILLGKENVTHMLIAIVALPIVIFINHWAWKIGLKSYTSASS